jgi:hypothetical protein
MSTRPRFWLRAVLALVLLLAVAAAFGWQRWRHWTPARTDYPMQGLALSAVHGVVDWGSLQTQNPDFVYVRAVNGQHGRDPAFSRNWAEAKAAGMRYGAEILFDPCFPASAQATVFVTTVPRDNAALPAAIRIDDAPACAALPGRDRVVSELNTLINLVEAHMGRVQGLHQHPQHGGGPQELRRKSLSTSRTDVCIIPPNSFALARTVEYFRIPRNVLTICLGKSTYARCGIIVNVTPFEPEWEGYVTLEFSNTTPLPAKIYATWDRYRAPSCRLPCPRSSGSGRWCRRSSAP